MAKTKVVATRLGPEEHRVLVETAAATGVDLSSLIRRGTMLACAPALEERSQETSERPMPKNRRSGASNGGKDFVRQELERIQNYRRPHPVRHDRAEEILRGALWKEASDRRFSIWASCEQKEALAVLADILDHGFAE